MQATNRGDLHVPSSGRLLKPFRRRLSGDVLLHKQRPGPSSRIQANSTREGGP